MSEENRQDDNFFGPFFQKVSYLYKQKRSKSTREPTQEQVWNFFTVNNKGTTTELVDIVNGLKYLLLKNFKRCSIILIADFEGVFL